MARAGRMPPAAHVAAKHRPARPSHTRARAHTCGPVPPGIRRDGCLPQEAKALQCRLRGRGVMGREGRGVTLEVAAGRWPKDFKTVARRESKNALHIVRQEIDLFDVRL